jgi:hypothetical protein
VGENQVIKLYLTFIRPYLKHHDIINVVTPADNEKNELKPEKYFPIYHTVGINENFQANHENDQLPKDFYGIYNVYIQIESDYVSYTDS